MRKKKLQGVSIECYMFCYMNVEGQKIIFFYKKKKIREKSRNYERTMILHKIPTFFILIFEEKLQKILEMKNSSYMSSNIFV